MYSNCTGSVTADTLCIIIYSSTVSTIYQCCVLSVLVCTDLYRTCIACYNVCIIYSDNIKQKWVQCHFALCHCVVWGVMDSVLPVSPTWGTPCLVWGCKYTMYCTYYTCTSHTDTQHTHHKQTVINEMSNIYIHPCT